MMRSPGRNSQARSPTPRTSTLASSPVLRLGSAATTTSSPEAIGCPLLPRCTCGLLRDQRRPSRD